MGRHKSQDPRSRTLLVKLTEQERKELAAYSAEIGLGMSEVTRHALACYLAVTEQEHAALWELARDRTGLSEESLMSDAIETYIALHLGVWDRGWDRRLAKD